MFVIQLDVPSYPHGKLRLIKPSLSHAPLSLKWLKDPEVGQYMGADFSDVSIATEEKRIQDLLENPDRFSWMVEPDGHVIGNIEINSIKETSEKYGMKAGKFSTLIGEKEHWGKRIAPHAKRAIMDWAFKRGGFELLIGRVLEENERSWRSLERLGFELQETESEADKGATRHWCIYAMTKLRWQSMAKK